MNQPGHDREVEVEYLQAILGCFYNVHNQSRPLGLSILTVQPPLVEG